MKNILNWNFANKISIVVGIFMFIYFIASTFLDFSFTNEDNLKAEYLSAEFKVPTYLKNVILRDTINKYLPVETNKFDLYDVLADSLTKHTIDYEVNSKIKKSLLANLPNTENNYSISSRVYSILYEIYSPIYFSSYLQTSIQNNGKRTVTELRLEIPVDGYFELYENSSLLKSGYFLNNIEIGELRADNKMELNIWSTYQDKFQLKDDLRYTHSRGVIKPISKEIVLESGFFYWLMKNSVLFFISLILTVYYILMIYDFLQQRRKLANNQAS